MKKKIASVLATVALATGLSVMAGAPSQASSYPVAGPYSTQSKCLIAQGAYDHGARIVVGCFYATWNPTSGWFFAYAPGE